MPITKMMIKGVSMPVSNQQDGDPLIATASYQLGAANRAMATVTEVALAHDDVVEMIFDDGTTWYGNADTLEDIFPEAMAASRSGSSVFELPSGISPTEDDRSLLGDIALKLLNIFSKKKLSSEIKKLAEDFEEKQLNFQNGVYSVDKNFNLTLYQPTVSSKPWLLFLHGTASSSFGSFGELAGTPLWDYIHTQYPGQVLAFQHATLTQSPLQNVEKLLNQLPQQASLHLISHSRGGFIGDILCRFCNGSDLSKGFDVNEINLLKKQNRHSDIQQIETINAIISSKKISIEKFIRVACPAAGTTLASGRLDHFFNISMNLLGLATGAAANPLFISFRALASAVVNCKNDTSTLPGLEAMDPDSPFIKVLNNPIGKVVLDNPLAIISGNCKTKFNLKALLILASRIFFQKNNDLVVNTASMHRGTQRLSRVQYFFDNDTNVDHFHYFKNADTQKALMSALKTLADEPIPGFELLQKDDAILDRNAILKLEGGQVYPETISGSRPIAVVLPGIMGSNLTVNDKLVWINYFRFLAGELSDISINGKAIEAPSVVRSSYLKLVKHLRSNYDVLVFPFDWRLQMNETAKQFAQKIEWLLSFKQPIKLIGHSMGGVLVRDFMVTQTATWNKLNASPGFKLLFLGSPLGGSFRIPTVLFGRDAIIDKLSKIDIFHSKQELLGIFSNFPGLLSLLPLSTDAENDFANSKVWEKMRAAHGKDNWPIPNEEDLKTFKAYRDGIVKGMKNEYYQNAVYVAGKDKATPCAYRIDESAQGNELIFLSTGEGDQSVTWASGIPAAIQNEGRLYYVNVSHGALANEPAMFKGVEEILQSGHTTDSFFSKNKPIVRGAEKLFKQPATDDLDISSDAVEAALLGLSTHEPETQPHTELKVWVSNGDLQYSRYPLLAGHFLNDGITSAEAYINKCLQHSLSDRHKLGIYPGSIGSSELFVLPGSDFNGALIVGLGALSGFTAYELTQTIQQAVSKYLLDIQKCKPAHTGIPGNIGISTLLIGSGYGGLSIENAIRAIIQGIQNANAKIAALKEESMPSIENVEVVELYEDNALNCFYSLRRIAQENEGRLKINVLPQIETVLGKRRRISIRSGEQWWNRITVRREKLPNEKDNETALRQTFVFTASTGAARDLERKIYINPSLLSEILEEISTSNAWNKELAKTIFELLVPNDFKEQLRRRSNSSWVLDDTTAAYPWELLQDRVAEARPLCVNAGLIRQLSEKESNFTINTVTANNALVVGDPFLNGFITQLPGAYSEAELAADLFAANNYTVTRSLQEKSSQIIHKLFSQDYKLMHLAGHGLFDAGNPAASGMVIGNNVFLTTAEIAQMSAVPELVFVNCCYLGKTDAQAEQLYSQRYRLAANIGTQLIRNGVRAVIVAGWAIDDGTAHEFAKVFYEAMFAGDHFGDAVKKARRHCYDKHGHRNNTWGAYQCYGDPYYQFDSRYSSKAEKETYVVAEEAEIDLENLRTAMAMGQQKDAAVYEYLQNISNNVNKANIRNGAITELEAYILADLMYYTEAIEKFGQLFKMEDAGFYVSTLEVFCNCKVKQSIAEFVNGTCNATQAAHQIDEVIKELKNLLYISPTAERFSLLGSTYKRKSILSNKLPGKIKMLELAAFYYMLASLKNAGETRIYSLTNWYILECVLVHLGKHQWGAAMDCPMTSEELESIKTVLPELYRSCKEKSKYELPTLKRVLADIQQESIRLASQKRKNITYNEMVCGINLRFCQMILEPQTSTEEDWSELLQRYRKLWLRIATNAKMMSEIEQLNILAQLLKDHADKKIQDLAFKMLQLKSGLQQMMNE